MPVISGLPYHRRSAYFLVDAPFMETRPILGVREFDMIVSPKPALQHVYIHYLTCLEKEVSIAKKELIIDLITGSLLFILFPVTFFLETR